MSGDEARARRLRQRLAVYMVADPEQLRPGRDLVEEVAAAIEGGVTAVQLRAKRLGGGEAWRLAVRLGEVCREHGVLFLVNDRLDVALAAEADGVHLGMNDLPLAVARGMAGGGFVLGSSPLTVAEAAVARAQGADYVGLGPVFPTPSKDDAQVPIGLGGLAAQVRAAALPSVGIGGITPENAGDVIRAGADGVAVIGAILGSDDPRAAARRLEEAVRGVTRVRGAGEVESSSGVERTG
jgi:thiamine-phosphate pyrophosphorylase